MCAQESISKVLLINGQHEDINYTDLNLYAFLFVSNETKASHLKYKVISQRVDIHKYLN